MKRCSVLSATTVINWFCACVVSGKGHTHMIFLFSSLLCVPVLLKRMRFVFSVSSAPFVGLEVSEWADLLKRCSCVVRWLYVITLLCHARNIVFFWANQNFCFTKSLSLEFSLVSVLKLDKEYSIHSQTVESVRAVKNCVFLQPGPCNLVWDTKDSVKQILLSDS